jgi:DNA-binding YbaB/EbfC family protein
MVNVTATGDMKITSITIDPEAVDPNDVSMLEDLVLAAVNAALEKANAIANEQVAGIAGGLNIPGLF